MGLRIHTLTKIASLIVPGSFEYIPEGSFIYFNRTDVQDAIHAPHIEWDECTSEDSFVDGNDNSLPSAVTVLPGVIERTQNVIIGHGALDMILYVFNPLDTPPPSFYLPYLLLCGPFIYLIFELCNPLPPFFSLSKKRKQRGKPILTNSSPTASQTAPSSRSKT